MAHLVGVPQLAPVRAEANISAYTGASGDVRQRVKYMVLPSAEKEQAPSSNSLFTSDSNGSGFCQFFFSSRLEENISALFIPVIPFRSFPFASFRVEVK